MKDVQKIEITPRTIIFTVLFLISLQILWMVRELLFSLFIAFIIASVAQPLVTRLEKYRVPRYLSAFIIFALLLSALGLGLYWILPSLAQDMTGLFRNLALLVENLDPNLQDYINGSSITQFIPNISNQIVPFLRNVFSNIVLLITTIFFSFYFILEENFIESFMRRFLKDKHAQIIAHIYQKAEKRMGSWFRGEIVLMFSIGVATYIGLNLIGVHHALSLAVIAGFLEAFPVIGPILAAIPALIFAVNQPGQPLLLGLSTVVLYILIQQLENNLLVPVVMKKAVGLNKILILIVLIIGGKLAGFLGLFIAIPLTLCIETILIELKNQK